MEVTEEYSYERAVLMFMNFEVLDTKKGENHWSIEDYQV